MQVQLTRGLVPPSQLKNASTGHHVASHQSWLRHANQKHPAILSSCHVKEMLEKKNWVQLDEPTNKNNMWILFGVVPQHTHVCHFIGRNHLPKINLLSSPQRLEYLNKNYAQPPDPPCSIRFLLVQKKWVNKQHQVQLNHWFIKWYEYSYCSSDLCFCQISNNLLHFNPLAKGCTWLVFAHDHWQKNIPPKNGK